MLCYSKYTMFFHEISYVIACNKTVIDAVIYNNNNNSFRPNIIN